MVREGLYVGQLEVGSQYNKGPGGNLRYSSGIIASEREGSRSMRSVLSALKPRGGMDVPSGRDRERLSKAVGATEMDETGVLE